MAPLAEEAAVRLMEECAGFDEEGVLRAAAPPSVMGQLATRCGRRPLELRLAAGVLYSGHMDSEVGARGGLAATPQLLASKPSRCCCMPPTPGTCFRAPAGAARRSRSHPGPADPAAATATRRQAQARAAAAQPVSQLQFGAGGLRAGQPVPCAKHCPGQWPAATGRVPQTAPNVHCCQPGIAAHLLHQRVAASKAVHLRLRLLHLQELCARQLVAPQPGAGTWAVHASVAAAILGLMPEAEVEGARAQCAHCVMRDHIENIRVCQRVAPDYRTRGAASGFGAATGTLHMLEHTSNFCAALGGPAAGLPGVHASVAAELLHGHEAILAGQWGWVNVLGVHSRLLLPALEGLATAAGAAATAAAAAAEAHAPPHSPVAGAAHALGGSQAWDQCGVVVRSGGTGLQLKAPTATPIPPSSWAVLQADAQELQAFIEARTGGGVAAVNVQEQALARLQQVLGDHHPRVQTSEERLENYQLQLGAAQPQ